MACGNRNFVIVIVSAYLYSASLTRGASELITKDSDHTEWS